MRISLNNSHWRLVRVVKKMVLTIVSYEILIYRLIANKQVK